MEWETILYPGVAQPAGDPSVWVEPVFFDGWMNPSTWLMPNYDPRFIGGDIANFPASFLQLSIGIHFGPNATGGSAEPTSVDVIVKPGTLEIRRPL